MEKRTHATSVETVPRRDAAPMFFVHCETCGVVGNAQYLEGDAEAIAARHQEIGGFER